MKTKKFGFSEYFGIALIILVVFIKINENEPELATDVHKSMSQSDSTQYSQQINYPKEVGMNEK